MTSSNKLLRELLFWICKRNNSSLIGQCAGHVTRFLKNFAFIKSSHFFKEAKLKYCDKYLWTNIFFWLRCVFVARHRALTNPIRVDYLMVSDEFYLLYALKWTFQNGQIICQKSPLQEVSVLKILSKTPAVAFGNWKGFILLIRKQELLKDG